MGKGNALATLGRYDEAETALRETLRRVPTYAVAHFNLALVLRYRQRHREAEVALRKALVHDRRYASAWAELGNLYLATGRPAAAVDAYLRAEALGRSDLGERIEQARRQIGGP
jgi:tetratricopeptide (TPR) repeat protein